MICVVAFQGTLRLQNGFAPRELLRRNSMNARVIIAVVMMVASNTASAGWPTGMIGGQIRRASPGASQALLAVTRSIPPQVKNSSPLYNTYPWPGGGRNAWQAAGGGRGYAPPPAQSYAPAPPARMRAPQQQLRTPASNSRGSESFGLSTASPPPPNRIIPRAANNR